MKIRVFFVLVMLIYFFRFRYEMIIMLTSVIRIIQCNVKLLVRSAAGPSRIRSNIVNRAAKSVDATKLGILRSGVTKRSAVESQSASRTLANTVVDSH